MNHSPTLVVLGHNRPQALRRLLESLLKAEYPPSVKLVLSIDMGGERSEAVLGVAQQIEWPHGEKEVIVHEPPLGLIGNFMFSGGLSRTYGSIILLEDDLQVSPHFYDYAVQALAHHADDQAVAGISLNALAFNGYTQQPFTPLLDGSDLFFMQIAWYHGQVYTTRMWSAYEAWLADNPKGSAQAPMHELFGSFPETDWFPTKMRFLIETDRFYAFPRFSYASNFGEVGTHFEQETRLFQTPLQLGRRPIVSKPLADSLAVYDSFQELLPSRLQRLNPAFKGLDLTLDLHHNKSIQNIRTPYVITSKPGREPLQTFGDRLQPLVANVIENYSGDALRLIDTGNLDTGRLATLQTEALLDRFYRRGRAPGRRHQLRLALGRRLFTPT